MSVRLVVALLGLLAIGAAIYFEDRRRRPDDAIDAIVEATRETIPDHVPDEWTQEFRR